MKDLVKLRRQCDQYMMMEAQLKSIGLKISTMAAQTEINEALRGATNIMTKANQAMDIKDIQQVMKQFVKNSERIDINREMMEAATEDISEEVEEEADASYEQILKEVGLELVNGQTVPTNKLKAPGEKSEVNDIEKQLEALKS